MVFRSVDEENSIHCRYQADESRGRGSGVRGGCLGRDVATAVQFFMTVFEASTEYSQVATDPDGVILVWNEGGRRLYGYEASEVIGRLLSVLHTGEDVRCGLPRASS